MAQIREIAGAPARPDRPGAYGYWHVARRNRLRRCEPLDRSARRPIVILDTQKRRRPAGVFSSYLPANYRDEIFTQSSWARAFSLSQSAFATSQLTMVRLACATWPLATLDVCME